jgi:hypothetical protein
MSLIEESWCRGLGGKECLFWRGAEKWYLAGRRKGGRRCEGSEGPADGFFLWRSGKWIMWICNQSKRTSRKTAPVTLPLQPSIYLPIFPPYHSHAYSIPFTALVASASSLEKICILAFFYRFVSCFMQKDVCARNERRAKGKQEYRVRSTYGGLSMCIRFVICRVLQISEIE